MVITGKNSQLNAVEKRNARVIAAAGAVKAVVEDPSVPILKLDSNVAEPPRDFRSPCFDDDAATPGFMLLVIHFIPDVKEDMFFFR